MVSPRVVRRGLVLGGCLLAATSLADDEYPEAVVDRPLTLMRGMLQGDVGFGFIRLPDYFSGGGGAEADGLFILSTTYGITDQLLAQIHLGFTFDELELGNPRLSTTYSLLRDDKFELAARANFTYLHEPPVGSFVRGDFSVTPDLVGKYLLTPDLRLDASLGAPLTFGDTTTIGLGLPISATYGITDQLYAGMSTGLGIYDFDYLDNTVVPFGVFGGYTTKFACYGMIDFKARLGFPELWVPNAGEMQDSSYPGYVEGMLEASLYWGGPINCNNDGDDPRDVVDPCKGRAGQGTLARDFGGNKPMTPKPTGRVFEMPLPTTGDRTGVYEAFRLLDFYLGGEERSYNETVMVKSLGVIVDEHGNPATIPMLQYVKGLETDAVILSGDFVDYLKAQASVVAAMGAAKLRVGTLAGDVLSDLGCGQSGTFTERGTSGPIQADGSATNLSLALGTFTLYWDATCEIGPKQCCLPDETCPAPNTGTKAPYNCQIKFTQFDTYNFSRTSGTGGTGWLKAINPIGWFGVKFQTFSYWTEPALGYTTGCM